MRQACDEAAADRFGELYEDNRYASGLLPQRLQRQRAADQDNVRSEAHELDRMGPYSVGVCATPAIVDVDVAAVAPAQLIKPLPERCHIRQCFWISLSERTEHSNSSDVGRLLRARRERPCSRTAEQRDEL